MQAGSKPMVSRDLRVHPVRNSPNDCTVALPNTLPKATSPSLMCLSFPPMKRNISDLSTWEGSTNKFPGPSPIEHAFPTFRSLRIIVIKIIIFFNMTFQIPLFKELSGLPLSLSPPCKAQWVGKRLNKQTRLSQSMCQAHFPSNITEVFFKKIQANVEKSS